jgi:hypothetical protein
MQATKAISTEMEEDLEAERQEHSKTQQALAEAEQARNDAEVRIQELEV